MLLEKQKINTTAHNFYTCILKDTTAELAKVTFSLYTNGRDQDKANKDHEAVCKLIYMLRDLIESKE
jgi:hypothetical protein